jgi:hypothetical protein
LVLVVQKANWICQILYRNCLLKHVIEEKIKKINIKNDKNEEEDVSSYWMTFNEGRRYWNLKQKALDRPL